MLTASARAALFLGLLQCRTKYLQGIFASKTACEALQDLHVKSQMLASCHSPDGRALTPRQVQQGLAASIAPQKDLGW